MNLLFVFKSRSEALRLYSILSKKGIAVSTINTPRAYSAGCGLSVLTYSSNMNIVANLIAQNNLNSFVGAYPR